jgi:hypothetical protein
LHASAVHCQAPPVRYITMRVTAAGIVALIAQLYSLQCTHWSVAQPVSLHRHLQPTAKTPSSSPHTQMHIDADPLFILPLLSAT